MKAYYCDEFVLPLPDGHRFRMEKYALLRQRVLAERSVPRRHERVLARPWEAGIPMAVVMGGGYAVPVADTLAIHARTVRLAAERNGTGDAAQAAGTGTSRSVPEPGERHA